jgi:hypothetical protein
LNKKNRKEGVENRQLVEDQNLNLYRVRYSKHDLKKKIHFLNSMKNWCLDICRTRHRGYLKNLSKILRKKNRILASCSFRRNVLFKESPPSIMVTTNPNWSTEILWFGTGYVKGKILSPLKRSAWGRLHCWFCLKLLNIYSLMLWWFVYNIPDSGVSEYLTTNNSNSGVGKYYVAIK